MNKILHIILIFLFGLTIFSCAKKEEEKTEAPKIAEVTVDTTTGRTAPPIAAGYSHNCAILDNASVKCWGYNGTGVLGIDNTNHMGDDSGEMDLLLGIDL